MTNKTKVTDEALDIIKLGISAGGTFIHSDERIDHMFEGESTTCEHFLISVNEIKLLADAYHQAASQHYEREIAILKIDLENNKNWFERAEKEITKLSTQVNKLRDFANDCRDYFEELPDQVADNFYVKDTCKNMHGYANKVLAATASQSLITHDDEIYDRCINIIEEWEHKPIMNQLLVIKNNIIGLKSK